MGSSCSGNCPSACSESPPAGVATRVTVPQPIRFREDRDRGLLVEAWINGSGPYVFAIDTGAGTSIVSPSFDQPSVTPVRKAYQTFTGRPDWLIYSQ